MEKNPVGLFRCYLIISCLLLLFTVLPAWAATDEETVAVSFLKFLRSDKTILSVEALESSTLYPSLAPATVAHLFHLNEGGYILVSTDRNISPIKAYSFVNDFAAMPEPYRRVLLAELELRVRVAQSATGRAPLEAGMTEKAIQPP